MHPVQMLELVLLLLGAALVLSVLAKRLRLPPAAALVVGGMALAVTPGTPTLQLDPELSLVLFLPPLLLSAGYFTEWSEFRANLRPILLLSVGAVVFTTAVVGVAAHLLMPALPWAMCFALGAIISPPDAVAAKAVFDGMSAPRRLITILEGESLLNDASGIVLYRLAVAAALTGAFDAAPAVGAFIWLPVCGVAVGAAVAALVLLLFRRMDDVHFVVLSSFLGAYAAYIGAERLHGSGVLAVVTAGIIVGGRQHDVLGAAVRMEIGAVWSSVTFVLEALVFVLIGLSLRGVVERQGGGGAAIVAAAPFALAVAAAALLARFLWVFAAVYLPRIFSRRLASQDPAPPPSVPLVIGWAGMRGVVSLAVALALPLGLPGRDIVIFAAFTFILLTVLVQGTTLGWLVQALGLAQATGDSGAAASVGVRARVAQASLDLLTSLRGEDGEPAHPQLIEDYSRRTRALGRYLDAETADHDRRRDHFATAVLAIKAGRRELVRLHREGQVSAETMRSLEGELDLEETRFLRLSQL